MKAYTWTVHSTDPLLTTTYRAAGCVVSAHREGQSALWTRTCVSPRTAQTEAFQNAFAYQRWLEETGRAISTTREEEQS